MTCQQPIEIDIGNNRHLLLHASSHNNQLNKILKILLHRHQAIKRALVYIIKAREIIDNGCNIAIPPDTTFLHAAVQVDRTVLLVFLLLLLLR